MARSVRLGVLDAAAFAAIFVFGIVMALLGAVMPVLSERLSLGLGDAGTLFLVTNASMLAASMVVGPVMDRYGMKAPLGLGGALVAAALGGIASAGSFGTLVGAVACLGFGGGAINAGANTLVADLHADPDSKASALNLLGVFFGIGALLLPFSVGALLESAGLAGLLWAAASLCIVTSVTTAALRFPSPKQAQGWPLKDASRFARTPLVVTLALLLFFESGNEFVLGGYFLTFLTQAFATPVAHASYLLAAFWAALMLGRLALSGGLVGRIGSRQVVLAGALAAAAGTVTVALAPSPFVAAAGIFFSGLALSGIFPTVLGVAGARFAEHSGTVFGILFTVALTGGMTMPWIAGHLAERSGLRLVFLLAAVDFVVIAVLNLLAHRLPSEQPCAAVEGTSPPSRPGQRHG